jgi:hypothetical protein
MGNGKPSEVHRAVSLVLRWQHRQTALEGRGGLLWLAEQHGAVGRLHFDEGRRAVPREDAVFFALILRGCRRLFSGRVKGSGAFGWVAGQRMASCLLAKRQRPTAR